MCIDPRKNTEGDKPKIPKEKLEKIPESGDSSSFCIQETREEFLPIP